MDRTAAVFPKTPWGSMGIKFFDFDNDGLLDLFVTDMHSDMSEEIGPEREKLKSRMRWPAEYLRRRASSSSATPSTATWAAAGSRRSPTALGAENYWPWGLSVGDLNADGWDDAFITSGMGFPFRYGVNTLLLNDRGREVRGRRVPAGRRAAAGRPHAHRVVRPGLRTARTRRAPRVPGADGADHA